MDRRILSIAVLHLRKRITQPRTWFFIIIMVICLDYSLGGMRDFLRLFNVKVPLTGLVALMLSDPDMHCSLLLMFALLMCDLPGWDHSEPYVLLRSGRDIWVKGKVLCVLLISLAYWLLVILISALVVWDVSFENSWGQAIRTLAETSATSAHDIRMVFSLKVMSLYAPITAFSLSLMLNLGLCLFTGLWAVVLNFVTRRPIGGVIIVAFALLDRSIGGLMVSGRLYRYSPVSLSSLEVIDVGYWATRPTLTYSVLFYVIGGAIPLCILLYAADRLAIRTASID